VRSSSTIGALGNPDYDLGVREMFEIGSLRHGTGVGQYSDADFLVSLKGVQPKSPWTMLNNVKESLQDRFPSTTVVVRRPAVVCRFSDADIEIVPAYQLHRVTGSPMRQMSG
jgi:SMODS domain-containing protein